MQSTKISKRLEALVARAAFNASRAADGVRAEDQLFVELLGDSGSLAYQSLMSYLPPHEIENMREQVVHGLQGGDGVIESYPFEQLAAAIEQRYPSSVRITTLHALHFLVSDSASLAMRSLQASGVEYANIDRELRRHDITSLVRTSAPKLSAPKRAEKPLAQFGVDLVEMAASGAIDPVVGREREIGRVVEILSRRKKSNPILIGEAGVGKSAIVEALALRVASGEIAPREIFSLDVGSLVAGTKFRGEFEERMQQLLEAITEAKNTVLFIDEIHTIVGAGSSNGSLDIANILKPALARGELQLIGATTIAEYRRDIEPDAALSRRFQLVMVEPPTAEASLEILRKLSPSYERHHSVSYMDEALRAAVELSMRYMADRFLPDKAIDIMDEAGARFRGESITREHISKVITTLTGIPEGRIGSSEMERLRGMATHLRGRVVGQDEAIARMVRAIRRSRSGLSEGSKPIGVFLFVGATGVGKTLLAKELSRWLFDGERSLIRLDMSEYNQAHTTSRLIGSPPGYVGYGSSGELTEAVRRHPYSVVLLDEIEKAHSDIYNLMLQLFDEGRLTDGAGRSVDFTNTIIIMTSNIGASKAASRPAAVGYNLDREAQRDDKGDLNRALERRFSPEFLGRVDDVIHFRTLLGADLEAIVALELCSLKGRMEALGYSLRITAGARRLLATLYGSGRYGARALRRTIIEQIEDPISELIVEGQLTPNSGVVVERKRGAEQLTLRVA